MIAIVFIMICVTVVKVIYDVYCVIRLYCIYYYEYY